MAPGGPTGPPDKPGETKVLPTMLNAAGIKQQVEDQKKHGFELQAMNQDFAVYYKDEDKKP